MAHTFGEGWTYKTCYDMVGLSKVPQRIGFEVNCTIASRQLYDEWRGRIGAADYTAIDTETFLPETGEPSAKFNDVAISCLTVSVPGNHNLVCFLYTDMVKEATRPLLLGRDEVMALVKLALSRPVVFMHNRLYDQRVLLNPINNPDGRYLSPPDFFRVVDTMGLMWALDTNISGRKELKAKKPLSLKTLGRDYLGLDMTEFGDNAGDTVNNTNTKLFAKYAARDGYATIELGMMLYRIFMEHDRFWVTLDTQLQSAMYYLQNQEVYTDVEPLKKLEAEVSAKLEDIKSEFMDKYGPVNLSSPKQKVELLVSLGYDTEVTTAKGAMSTSKRALEKLVEKGCNAAELMLEYNKYSTLLTAFIKKTIDFIEAGNPVRFNFATYRVPTGRFAAGAYYVPSKGKSGKAEKATEPYNYFIPQNMQAQAKPVHIMRELDYDPATGVGRFLGPDEGEGQWYVEAGSDRLNTRCWIGGEPGHTIVETDYHTLELLVPTNLSMEPVWIKAFQERQDLHKATAVLMFQVPYDQVTPEQRNLAKRCVSVDSRIETPDGWARASRLAHGHSGEFLTGRQEILAPDGSGQTWTACVQERPGCDVVLSNGQVLTVTDDHVCYLYDRAEVREAVAGGLEVGDMLACRREPFIRPDAPYHRHFMHGAYGAFTGDIVLNEDMAYYLGAFMGHGCVNRVAGKPAGVRLWARPDAMPRICRAVTPYMGRAEIRVSDSLTPGLKDGTRRVVVTLSSTSLGLWTDMLCRDPATHGHLVPDCLFTSRRSVIKAAVAGFMDSRVYVSVGQTRMFLGDPHLRFTADIADLLVLAGVYGCCRSRTPEKDGHAMSVMVVHVPADVPLMVDSVVQAVRPGPRTHVVWRGNYADDLPRRIRRGTKLPIVQRQRISDVRRRVRSNLFQEDMEAFDWPHKDYFPVYVIAVRRHPIQAFVMECQSHKFRFQGYDAHNCSFSLMYSLYEPDRGFEGMAFTLNTRCGIPLDTARDVVPRYVAALPKLYEWKLRVYDEAMRTGMVVNPFGFEYRIRPYMRSGDFQAFKFGKKLAVSDLSQGMGGWFGRMFMVKFAKALYYPDAPWAGYGIKFVNQIHDSAGFSVRSDSSIKGPHGGPLLTEWIDMQVHIMESVTPRNWVVPLEADPSISVAGGNYGELFSVHKEGDLYVPDSSPEKRPGAGRPEPSAAPEADPDEAAVDDMAEVLGLEV